jgi:hypothetical protein
MAEPTTPHDENTAALYSVFCGAIAVPTAFLFGIGALFGAMAIVLGRTGLRRAEAGEGRRGMAIAGIVLGLVSFLFVLALIFD